MIVGHHAGEELLLLSGAGAVGTVPALLIVFRVRLERLVRWLRG
jgi:hypothetical protein